MLWGVIIMNTIITNFVRKVAIASATVSLSALCVAPAMAATSANIDAPCWNASSIEAAKLRQLDVMLLVGSLRCRANANDFRPEYDAFLTKHRTELGKANQIILTDFRNRVGAVNAFNALDKASVKMANGYGEQSGIGCRDLKQLAGALATAETADLPHAADVMVGQEVQANACPAQVATLTK